MCRFADLNIAPPKDYTRACSLDSQAEIIVSSSAAFIFRTSSWTIPCQLDLQN